MINNKPYKLILCFMVAMFAFSSAAWSVPNKPDVERNFAVRDLMNRRRNDVPLRQIEDLKVQKITVNRHKDMPQTLQQPKMRCSRTPVMGKQGSCVVSNRTPMQAQNIIPVLPPQPEPILEQTPAPLPPQQSEPLAQPLPMAYSPVFVQEPVEEVVYYESYVDKDGSLFPGGDCVSCNRSGTLLESESCDSCNRSGPLVSDEPCENCNREPVLVADSCPCAGTVLNAGGCSCDMPEPLPLAAPLPLPETNCCDLAPIQLAHVDFNLSETKEQTKVGNYRFRIFGCRRYEHDAVLNKGRLMEKDMNFIKVFEKATSDCYKIINVPDDLCLQTTPTPLPEYILTAEIKSLNLDVCDAYNWDEAKSGNVRSGSADMLVHWRLTNLTKDTVLWEGDTNGYSDLNEATENGEIKLVEDAFADAISTLRAMPGFEDQLAVRLTAAELTAARQALIDEEVALDPVKCHYKPDFEQCKPVQQQCVVVDDVYAETQIIDAMCIIDRPPYETLTPENLYKLRASVVEINGAQGKKGAGLIISETFVLTSANLVGGESDVISLRTINGKTFTGRVVRVNTGKNVALVKLDTPTEYMPLSLNLDLPQVGQGNLMVLGMLDVNNFQDGENYISTNGKVTGFRYSEDKGSEIMLDTDVQNMTIGGVLIDEHGTIYGIAHTGEKTEGGKDLFLPTETALRSVGLSICEKLYEKRSPWEKAVVAKPVTEKIITAKPKAPEALAVKDRK